MQRDIDLAAVSDGRLYTSRDMARIGCHDCAGCFDCCRDMEDTIVLDPYDMWRLCGGLKDSFDGLNGKAYELVLTEGLVLPHLKNTAVDGRCIFLNEEGRCRIHAHRPGICRLFPLARIYDGDDFKYFIQVNECPAAGKTKVRIEKWLETPRIRDYEAWLSRWHNLTRRSREVLAAVDPSSPSAQQMIMLILTLFYQRIIPGLDFYEQFDKAAATLEKLLTELGS
ncbi:MAG: YkgJ family cysteine cluster protein [Lachnospiraceae bacterium]|nr:YkgJ family cysteine cluster protein [Lachnospiraceae bacterium]